MGNREVNNTKYGILLMSDFHICDELLNRGVKSIVEEDSFINRLTECINTAKGNQNAKVKYIMLLGDIAYGAWPKEYTTAISIIEKLCKNIEVARENVLIVPGNHDVNHADSQQFCSDYVGDTLDEKGRADLQKKKLQKFATFYNDFYKDAEEEVEKFDPGKAVFRTIVDKEMGVVFLGINTNFKESHLDHGGSIPYSRLQEELDVIKREHGDEKIIAMMHHRPSSFESTDAIENEDWYDLADLFKMHNTATFFFGGFSRLSKGFSIITDETRNIVVSGSIHSTQKDVPPTFMLLWLESNEYGKSFSPESYKYEINHWQIQDMDPEISKKIILETKTGRSVVSDQLAKVSNYDQILGLKNLGLTSQVEYDYSKALEKFDDNEQFKSAEDFVLDCIKKNNLYLLGDFRWSREGKSISFILMDFFFDNYNCFKKVKRCYQLMLNTFDDVVLKHIYSASYQELRIKSGDNADTVSICNESIKDITGLDLLPKLMIGYEMNGNMIGVSLAIMNRYDYTYLPASNRNHSEFEKRLPEDNGQYKHIIVVIDLIYTRTLLNSLAKIIEKKYPNVKIIQFIALIEGVRETKDNVKKIVTNSKAWFSKDNRVLRIANSVCKIPMITGNLEMINSNFIDNKIIPSYRLYSRNENTNKNKQKEN